MIKRIIAMLMAIAMIATLAACGGSKDSSSKSATEGVDFQKGASTDSTELFGELKGTKLRVGIDVDLADWQVDMLKQLEDNVGLVIETQPVTGDELITQIAQAVASGDKRNYFDTATVANSSFFRVLYGNLMIPLDDYIYYDDPVWKYDEATDFNALDLFKLNGSYWAATEEGYHEAYIFYNKTYFEEMQAPDPYEEYYLKDNWTFETFRETCEKVTKKDASGATQVYAWATWDLFTFISATGGDLIRQTEDGSSWESALDDPKSMAGLELLHDSVKNGWTLYNMTGNTEFVDRKVAMVLGKPSFAMSPTNAYSRMTDEIGMVPFPKLNKEQEKYICPMDVSAKFIAACSQNPQGAAAYLYYYRIAEQNRDKSEWGQTNLLRFLNEEANERRNEYLAKCDYKITFVDGLINWYQGTNRALFLDIIMKDLVKPAVAVDQMNPLLKDCIRQTVG